MGLGDPVGFESLQKGRASQRKVAGLSFDAVGFSHGESIVRDVSTRFGSKWEQGTVCQTGETPALSRVQKSAREPASCTKQPQIGFITRSSLVPAVDEAVTLFFVFLKLK